MDVIKEQTCFKTLVLRDDEDPRVIWQSTVYSSEEYYALLKKLTLFASILQERGMKCPVCNEVIE